jgi:hypothetical protein
VLGGKLRKGGAMRSGLVAFAVLISVNDPARCQVDTSSYPRSYPAPSALDTMSRFQQLELQRQQIELQRLQIEQQRMQNRQLEDQRLQRQLEFEHQQAELYRQRQLERAKVKKNSN